ncbi:MAG TPA: hypothetical protein VEL06_11395 [Haliangiales bacterium]|nr:hypothetical protein [Haliangiales bacterium]
MEELTPPDSHYLSAATGWCDLGNFAEARAELRRISAGNRDHPRVLEEEWRICAAEKHWLPALEVARRLIEVAPHSPAGWINQSYSLHEMKLTREARNQLLPVAEKFCADGTIPYNLACYACQLGDLEEARQWLARAIKIRGRQDIQKMALSDPDLQPMWAEIKKL